MRNLAKSDRKAGLALIDEVDPLNRGKVIEALAPILVSEGENCWPQLRDLMNSMSDIDDRMRTMENTVLGVWSRDRSRIRPFLDEMNLNPLETSQALAVAAALSSPLSPAETPEPVSARMAWVVETATPAERDEAVKRTIEKLGRENAGEVTAWIDGLETGPMRDSAIEGQTSSLMWSRKFDEALNRAQMISNPERRQTTIEHLHQSVEVMFLQPDKTQVIPETPTDSAE